MEQAVTKGEFAAIIGVSPGRVSQYLAEGKISQASLVGSGRSAKIIVDRARADLRLTLDVSQRLGNGSETRLDAVTPMMTDQAGAILVPPSGSQTYDPDAPRGTDHEIKLQKLEQIKRINRNAAIAEAKEAGTLIETASAKAEMGRIASAMLDVFEGGLNDMASAVAAKFELPQRDVKHLLRGVWREIREAASKRMAERAITIQPLTQTVIAVDETDQADLS